MAYTTIKKPSDYFETKLYTGDDTNNREISLGLTPDLTWIKARSVAYSHILFDRIRGLGFSLNSNGTNADRDVGTEFSWSNSGCTTDSFTVDRGSNETLNETGRTMVAWNWKANGAGVANTDGSISSTVSANTTSGFSIVSYTGNGTSDSSIGHGLGATPKITITKNLTTANSWRFTYYFVDGSRDRLLLDTTTTKFDSDPVTANDNNVFYVDSGSEQNTSGDNYIAYCFAEKQGFSKFGSYTGNGSASDGTFVYTGFKPAFVIVKRTDNARDWVIFDNKRNSFNVMDKLLYPNTSGSEGVANTFDFLSNGFKNRSSAANVNASGGSYIYMAFAEQPLVGDNPATAR